jgi:dienelactone hydrolase
MRYKGIWIGLGIVLLLGAIGFFTWNNIQRDAMPVTVSSLETNSQVGVLFNPWLVFESQIQTPTTGFILYPGGFVDPKAYAPIARDIAAAGYLVVIPPMPLNLAVLDMTVAGEIIAAYPEILHWAIGGHSLGGSMAASFSKGNPNLIDGLVLWASYLADNIDLSKADLIVTSIYGTLDGVATPEEVLAAKPLLPTNTLWVAIEGGNHAQFGWYGLQEGDNPASISPEAQQDQIVKGTLSLLSQLAP